MKKRIIALFLIYLIIFIFTFGVVQAGGIGSALKSVFKALKSKLGIFIATSILGWGVGYWLGVTFPGLATPLISGLPSWVPSITAARIIGAGVGTIANAVFGPDEKKDKGSGAVVGFPTGFAIQKQKTTLAIHKREDYYEIMVIPE